MRGAAGKQVVTKDTLQILTKKILRKAGSGSGSSVDLSGYMKLSVYDADADGVVDEVPAHTHDEDDLSFTDVTTGDASSSKHGLLPKLPADATKFLNGAGAYTTPSGAGADISAFRHYGTTTYEAWYCSAISGVALTTLLITANYLYAVPLIAGKDMTLDYLGAYVTAYSNAGSICLGIYADGGNCYPGSLLVSGATAISATGAYKKSISQALSAGTLYWLIFTSDAANTFRAIAADGMPPILGWPSGLTAGIQTGIKVAYTFTGSLPSTFPTSSPSFLTTAMPAVFIRRSA